MPERSQGLTASVSTPEPNGPETAAPTASLRCQWCSVDLADGVMICPTCGSAGIPDPTMVVPDEEPEPEPVVQQQVELVEWWREDEEPGKPTRQQLSVADTEARRQQSIIFIVAAVLVCAVAGWLAGPLLAGAMESLTGTPVENTGDLRPTGGFIGVMFGFMVGAFGGWMIWASR